MPGSEKREPGATDRQTLSIGALSRATRIPIETLRTWERRYGAPMPIRKPSGHRVYPAGTVEHLQRVARLLAQGHRPGEILRLSLSELDRLLALSKPAAQTEAHAVEAVTPAETMRKLLRATAALDRGAILRELRASWARLGPLRFLEDVAGGFMVEVGRAWSDQSIEVRHEHFASACLSDFLRAVREPYEQRARGPRIVAAMLPGETHEGGLLIVATLLAIHGYRILYLGANTPIDQVAAAARGGDAEAVALSVSAATSRKRSAAAIAELRDLLPRRMALWVGGAGAPPAIPGVERFGSLVDLDARLTGGS
jgi:methanogenic corrinoid protein MtbC1